MMSGTEGHSAGTRTLRGMFWSYGSYVCTRGASLLATAILSRIITPRDFGVIALAGTFMTFLDMLQGLGVGSALVVVKDGVEEHAETAFVVSVAVGLALMLAMAALGPAAVALFHEHQLLLLMPALGLTFLLYAVGSTHYSLAAKAMDFRSRTWAELADAGARGVVGVALAVAGAGVWSLVAGYIAGTLAMSGTLWLMIPWRPRLRPQRRHVRGMLSFGGASVGVGLMAAFLAQFDNIVVGRVLGPTQLGFYTMATKLPYLFIVSLAAVAGNVMFPAFASLDRNEMGRAFLTSLRYAAMITLPLTVVLAVLAEPLTVAVFGPRWRPAVAAMQVLCLWALVSPISVVSGNALKSRGRADIVLWIAIPQAVAIVVGSILIVRQGIVAVSWLQALIALVAQLVTSLAVQRMFRLSPLRMLVAVAPPVLAAGALAVVLVVLHRFITSPWPVIIAGGSVGAVTYAGVLHAVDRNMLPRLWQMAFPGHAVVAVGDRADELLVDPVLAEPAAWGPPVDQRGRGDA